MFLMYMDMINEDRFTYCVLITYTTLNDFQGASIKSGTWNIPEHEKIKIFFMKK